MTDHAALFRFESTDSDSQTSVGFFLPTPPVGKYSRYTSPHRFRANIPLKPNLSQPVVIFLAPFEQISLPYDLIEAKAQFTPQGSSLTISFDSEVLIADLANVWR